MIKKKYKTEYIVSECTIAYSFGGHKVGRARCCVELGAMFTYFIFFYIGRANSANLDIFVSHFSTAPFTSLQTCKRDSDTRPFGLVLTAILCKCPSQGRDDYNEFAYVNCPSRKKL